MFHFSILYCFHFLADFLHLKTIFGRCFELCLLWIYSIDGRYPNILLFHVMLYELETLCQILAFWSCTCNTILFCSWFVHFLLRQVETTGTPCITDTQSYFLGQPFSILIETITVTASLISVAAR